MKEYPVKVREWHPSIWEDWRRARNDDERKRILYLNGYPPELEHYARKLYGLPPEELKELDKQRRDEAKRKAADARDDRREQIRIGLIVGIPVAIVSSIISAVITHFFPQILDFFAN